MCRLQGNATSPSPVQNKSHHHQKEEEASEMHPKAPFVSTHKREGETRARAPMITPMKDAKFSTLSYRILLIPFMLTLVFLIVSANQDLGSRHHRVASQRRHLHGRHANSRLEQVAFAGKQDANSNQIRESNPQTRHRQRLFKVHQPNQRVPEQMPIVVSSSDNSYVSASPIEDIDSDTISNSISASRSNRIFNKRTDIESNSIRDGSYVSNSMRRRNNFLNRAHNFHKSILNFDGVQHLAHRTSKDQDEDKKSVETMQESSESRREDQHYDNSDIGANNNHNDDDDDEKADGQDEENGELNTSEISTTATTTTTTKINDDDDTFIRNLEPQLTFNLEPLDTSNGSSVAYNIVDKSQEISEARTLDLDSIKSSLSYSGSAENQEGLNIDSHYYLKTATIIKTKESIRSGATFINFTIVTSLNACLIECWITDSCDTAIYQESPVDFNDHLPDSIMQIDSRDSRYLQQKFAGPPRSSPLSGIQDEPSESNETRKDFNRNDDDSIEEDLSLETGQVVQSGFYLCYLFQCSKLDGFKCQFSAHNYYISSTKRRDPSSFLETSGEPKLSNEIHYAKIIPNSQNHHRIDGRKQYHDSRLVAIDIGKEDVDFSRTNLNSAIIAIMFGVAATGMLIVIVGYKMRSIRRRLAYKSRRRSLVPDADFLINTIPLDSSSLASTLSSSGSSILSNSSSSSRSK